MRDISIQLSAENGEPLGKLRTTALQLIEKAEQEARNRNISKTSALKAVFSEVLEENGFIVSNNNLSAAFDILDSFRRGKEVSNLQVMVQPIPQKGNGNGAKAPAALKNMPNNSQLQSFFEIEKTYPDEHAQEWYERLKGIDEHKERLLLELEMMLFPNLVEEWSRLHHRNKILKICELQRNRIPLVIMEGDVGTGKTALAETVGDALARRAGKNSQVHLLKINTQIRGTGLVGEMSDLIAQAFGQVEARAKALKNTPILLLIDEADALAASRDTSQMHHEDKAGLNTVLQRLDNLRLTQLPVAVIFITNRPDALDPAVRRRAALNLHFERPNEIARAEIIKSSVPELTINDEEIKALIHLTSEKHPKNNKIGFTASDLTDRLLAGAFRRAYKEKRAFTVEDLLSEAQIIEATPSFGRV
jgi:SpoVK/Ycf46/Vps4 family AAA+-type ATPase